MKVRQGRPSGPVFELLIGSCHKKNRAILPRPTRMSAMRETPARPVAPRGLYLVTRETADTDRLVATVHAALDGGAVRVQYRDKSTDRASRFAQALALKHLCDQYGADFVINDDVELARSLDAGVHVGRDDSSIADARRVLGPNATVGASCYDSL